MDEDLGRCSIQAFWNCTGCSKVPFPGCRQTSCHVASGLWNCRIGYPKDGSKYMPMDGWLLIKMKSSTFLSETGTLQNTFRDTVQWHIGVYQRDAAGWTSNSSRQRMSKQQTSFDWKISSNTEKQPPTESCSLQPAACLVRKIAAMLLTPNQHSTKAYKSQR